MRNLEFFDLFLQEDGLREEFDEVKAAGIAAMYDSFTNNGWCISNDKEDPGRPMRMELNDVLSTPDATRFIPRVVQYIVREAIEPNLLVVPMLFDEIRVTTNSKLIEIGAIGSLYAADIEDGHEYPERNIDFDGGDMVSVTIRKSGLRISVTDEVIEDSQWDILNLWLRAAGRALARHKEQKALKLFNEMGITIFNNNQAAQDGEIGATTGRDITGTPNGSMTLNDLMDMYIHLALRGFNPDTLLMNPLSWKMFATDPEVREIVLSGATLATRRMPAGQSFSGWPTGHSGMGLRTFGTGTSGTGSEASAAGTVLPASSPWIAQLTPFNATFNVAPKGIAGPLTVIISPYVPFTASVTGISKPAASVIMLDSNNAGILATREPVGMEEFRDAHRDIRSMKLRERYGFSVPEQGKGISIARNVVIARNYVFDNVNNQVLAEIDQRATTPTAAVYA